MTRLDITEKDFRQQILDLAHLLGWKAYFTWNSLHSPAGFPDLVMVHEEKRQLIFAELKSEKGKVTVAQYDWLTALEKVSKQVYLWKPSDWDYIVKVLEGKEI
jgi:hypothetical protein